MVDKSLLLARASVTYALTAFSPVILYIMHSTRVFDIKFFALALVVVQCFGIMLLIDDVYSLSAKNVKYQSKILDAKASESIGKTAGALNESRKEITATFHTNCFVAMLVFSQLTSVLGENALSIIYFDSKKISTKVYVVGLMICFAIGISVSLEFDYISNENDIIVSRLIELQTDKIDQLRKART